MKKRFIILVDFSEYSENLIRYAYSWAQQVNAELMLVHQTIVVAPVLTDTQSRQQIVQHTNDEALQKLKELAEGIIPSAQKTYFLVSENVLHHTLNKLIGESFENLIFAGIKGTGLLKKIFLGSTLLEVIDHTNNSMVAIPKDIAVFSHKKIYVAVSEKYPLNMSELNKILNPIHGQHIQLTFFYLASQYENTETIEKQLIDLAVLFADRFNTSFLIYEGNHVFDDIKKVINNKIDEILIIQKGSRLLTDQIFRKFLINELVYEGQTPLIVLP